MLKILNTKLKNLDIDARIQKDVLTKKVPQPYKRCPSSAFGEEGKTLFFSEWVYYIAYRSLNFDILYNYASHKIKKASSYLPLPTIGMKW